MENENYFEGIYEKLVEKLSSAKTDIKAAVTWFTDYSLIDVLAARARAGVKVEVIIAENESNYKVDYSKLTDAGANVMCIPANGKGIMHQKFCVVDAAFVISGSYNWSNNARSRNSENITIQYTEGSVKGFLDQFEQLKALAKPLHLSFQEGFGEATEAPISPVPAAPATPALPKASTNMSLRRLEIDFKEEWNVYIRSNVLYYDREALKEKGWERAESTRGNPNIIGQHLNSVYQDLISDTEIDTKELDNLKNALDQKAAYHIDVINAKTNLALGELEVKKIASARQLGTELENKRAELRKLEADKKLVEDAKLKSKREKKEGLQNEIDKIEVDRATPRVKKRTWIILAPLFAVTVYLFIFYSSVMYTIVYGAQDAKEAGNRGEEVSVELFNSAALEYAWDKGWTVLLFISLFAAIPLVVGLLMHIAPKRYMRWLYGIGALGLDFLLAYLIARNSYEIRLLGGQVTSPWEFSFAPSTPEFWLVLALGFFTYLIWGGLMAYIWKQFDLANEHEHRETQKEKIKQKKTQIETINQEIAEVLAEVNTIKKHIEDINAQIAIGEKNLNLLEHEIEQERVSLEQQKIDQTQQIRNQKDRILAYLNRDRVPISFSSLRDRINTFLSGWDKWLYAEYAVERANKMVEEVHAIVDQWLKVKENELEG